MSVSSRIRNHLRHNVWGIAACFIALGGTAAALPGKNSVDSRDIKPGNVKLSDLAKNSVNSSKVVDDSLTGSDILESSLVGVSGPAGARGATGATGTPGAMGATGPTGQPGSDASLSSVPAGGDLTGFYPNPTIGTGVVDAANIANTFRSITIGASQISDPLTHGADLAPTRNAAAGTVPSLSFSASTKNAVTVVTVLPGDYSIGGSVSVDLDWSPATNGAAGANTVVWGVSYRSIAQLGNVEAIEGTVTDPSVGTSANNRVLNPIGLGTTGFGTGNLLILTIFRDPADAGDTHTGIANLHSITVRYLSVS